MHLFPGQSSLSGLRWDHSIELINLQRSKVRTFEHESCSDPTKAHSFGGKQASLCGHQFWLVADSDASRKGETFVTLFLSKQAQGDTHWNIISLSEPVTTSWIKITVKDVYGTVNNGFKEIAIFEEQQEGAGGGRVKRTKTHL